MRTPTHPSSSPPPAPRGGVRAAWGVVLVLAGAALLGVLAASLSPARPRSSGALPASMTLSARLDLAGHGAWYGFTAPCAGTLRLSVSLPEGVASTLLWGPLGTPAPGEPPHLPSPTTAERIAVSGRMAEPLVRRLAALGPHVVYVEQPPLAMGGMGLEATITVELLPDAPAAEGPACPEDPR